MWAGSAPVTDTRSYGLGWQVDARNEDLGTSTIWHTGAVHGYHAIVVLLPDIDRAVVVLQNIYGEFQAADLNAAGLGSARMLAGGEADTPPGDMPYPLVLGGMLLVLVLLVVATAWPIYRLWRPASGVSRVTPHLIGTLGWVAGGLILAWLAVSVLPGLAGGDRLELILLWAPDIGWLMIAIAVAAVALTFTRLVTGLVGLKRLWPRPG